MLVMVAGCRPGSVEQVNTPAPCSTIPPYVPPTVAPTVDFQPTIYAVQTESALICFTDLTQNAPTPTLTNWPTSVHSNTPLPEKTNTATATLKPLWTQTPTQSAWGCTYIESLPEKSTSFAPNVDFDAT